MTNWIVNEFKEKILKGQEMPHDLEAIIKNKCCLSLMEDQLEFSLIEEGRIEEEIACTYISEEARRDIAIQASIIATNKIFEYITFFAEAENGMLLGYWHGEEGLNILEAPLVSYDTEGRFELLYGNQIIEQLIMKWTSEDEDEYEEIQSLFSECDVEVASIYTLKEIETKSDPANMYDTLYELKKEELAK